MNRQLFTWETSNCEGYVIKQFTKLIVSFPTYTVCPRIDLTRGETFLLSNSQIVDIHKEMRIAICFAYKLKSK